jgi:8-oxo-dGTP pyrophosphatase MutT (NUDIX family)
VLVPLVPVGDAIHLLFIRRAADLAHHRGQIAFPGGRQEPSDASFVDTALREAHEEIGLRPNDVRVLGTLDDIETMTSRFLITPIAGDPTRTRGC